MIAHRYAQTILQLSRQLHGKSYAEADLNFVRKAYGLAVVLFTGRFQPSGKSFLAHVVGTASILASVRSSAPVLAAGLLHNVYEHGDFGTLRSTVSRSQRREIVRLLGSEVEQYIAHFSTTGWKSAAVRTALSNPAQLSITERNVLLIRLADLLEHLLDLDLLYYHHKVRGNYISSSAVAVGTAEKLGFGSLAAEIEKAVQETGHADLPVALPLQKVKESSFVIVPRSCCKRMSLALVRPFIRRSNSLNRKVRRRIKMFGQNTAYLFQRERRSKLINRLAGSRSYVGHLEIRTQEFKKLFPNDASLVRVATGFRFTEGPVWIEGREMLLFSDIPANQILCLESSGRTTVFREPSGNSNGLTRDTQGRLVACEHGHRRITRTEEDGSITTLAERFEGKKLNSPNDVVVKSDGAIYFTDPSYGIRADEQEQEVQGVYRLSPDGKELSLVASDFARPNGLAFSPDERKLYIDDSERRHIRVFNVEDDGSLTGGAVFHDMDVPIPGAPDGMKVDGEGRVFCTGASGVWVFDKHGNHLGTIFTPEKPSNCAWGDDDWQSLYVTACTSVYKIRLNGPGIKSRTANPETQNWQKG